MRLGTRLYHFNSGPPLREDKNIAGNYGNHFPSLEVQFIEESVSGPTLSDLLDKLPAGWGVVRTGSGHWMIDDGDCTLTIGVDLPSLLREVLRG